MTAVPTEKMESSEFCGRGSLSSVGAKACSEGHKKVFGNGENMWTTNIFIEI